MKLAFIVLFIFLEFMLVNTLLIQNRGIGEIIGAAGVAVSGFHYIYGVIFNTKIYMGGYIVEKGERQGLRFLMLVGGVAIIFLCFYLALSVKPVAIK